MYKVILVLGFFLISVAYAQTDRCGNTCRDSKQTRIVCARDSDGKNCQKVQECRLRELNCLRRRQNKPLLRRTSIQRCSNIKTSTGEGLCSSRRRRPRRDIVQNAEASRDCRLRNCKDDGIARCNRTPNNQCQLLTNCQRDRLNCRRGSRDRLRSTRMSSCRGMKRGDRARRCL